MEMHNNYYKLKTFVLIGCLTCFCTIVFFIQKSYTQTVIEGNVIATMGTKIICGIGKNQGVEEGTEYEIKRNEQLIAVVVAEKVNTTTTLFKVVQLTPGYEIKLGDKTAKKVEEKKETENQSSEVVSENKNNENTVKSLEENKTSVNITKLPPKKISQLENLPLPVVKKKKSNKQTTSGLQKPLGISAGISFTYNNNPNYTQDNDEDSGTTSTGKKNKPDTITNLKLAKTINLTDNQKTPMSLETSVTTKIYKNNYFKSSASYGMNLKGKFSKKDSYSLSFNYSPNAYGGNFGPIDKNCLFSFNTTFEDFWNASENSDGAYNQIWYDIYQKYVDEEGQEMADSYAEDGTIDEEAWVEFENKYSFSIECASAGNEKTEVTKKTFTTKLNYSFDISKELNIFTNFKLSSTTWPSEFTEKNIKPTSFEAGATNNFGDAAKLTFTYAYEKAISDAENYIDAYEFTDLELKTFSTDDPSYKSNKFKSKINFNLTENVSSTFEYSLTKKKYITNDEVNKYFGQSQNTKNFSLNLSFKQNRNLFYYIEYSSTTRDSILSETKKSIIKINQLTTGLNFNF